MTEAVCSWEQVPVRVLVLAFLQVPIHVPARVLVLVQVQVLASFAWAEPRTTGRLERLAGSAGAIADERFAVRWRA
jgi:hypothetical protein